MSDTTVRANPYQEHFDLLFERQVPLLAKTLDPYQDLPPYSGLESACPKCLSEQSATYYHPAMGEHERHSYRTSYNVCQLMDTHYSSGVLIPEHLERRCGNCKYEWAEKIADRIAEAHEH